MTDIKINGWSIFLHSLFLAQYNDILGAVDRARLADPVNYESKRISKLFAATRKVAFEEIPKDPSDPRFRQGNTLGSDYKHWFRGKYFQQYRLFFRFNERERIIILAWMNDEGTKRAYESRTDAYRVFAKMLDHGRPPDDWATLLKEATETTSRIDGNL